MRLSLPLDQLRPTWEVIVVGSGYGGAVAASRLARAGRDVCVLERGRERWPGEYPRSLWGARRDIQVNSAGRRMGDRRGLFEFHVNPEINALVGCGLGGTSLINANVVEPAETAVFTDPVWPQALRSPDGEQRPLLPYETRAKAMLRPRPYPERFQSLAKVEALERSAAAMGAGTQFRRPALAVSFERHEGPGGVVQGPCTSCGDCMTGCNHGAKNTTLMNYLPDAVAHGARVFCEIEVVRLSRTPDDRWQVHVRVLGSDRHRFGTAGEFPLTADLVVLGAGALGSTGIMLRSAAAGLELSPALGTRFSGNADMLAFGYDSEVDVLGFSRRGGPPPRVGPCIAGLLDRRGAEELDDGFVLEEGSVASPISSATTWLLAGLAEVAGDPRMATLGRLRRQLASIVHGPARGAAARTQVYLAMGHDGSDGRLVLDGKGDVRISWPRVGGKPIFDRIDAAIRDANRAIGADHLRNPLWSSLFGKDLMTVHPLGGCPMSDDPAVGVVDGTGRVYSRRPGETHHPGLLVLDGAIVPRSVGINPLLTITALAEWGVAQLAGERGWRYDERPAPPLPATRRSRRPRLPRLPRLGTRVPSLGAR